MFFRRHTAQPRQRNSGTGNRYPTDAQIANRHQIYSLARQQHGLASWGQLRRRDLAGSVLTRAIRSERLFEAFEGVYSIVPLELMSPTAWNAAAVLAGGKGACLGADSGAWWTALVREKPKEIHVAVLGVRKPQEGIQWHRRPLAEDERIVHNRMPVMAPARIPLDLARTASLWELKGVLAELEYHWGIEAADVILHKGFTGAPKLRLAIAEHTPQLARTRSQLEECFVFFLSERRFLIPPFNYPLGSATVDALYEEQGVVVELDGVRGHSGERRVLRDHRRDLHRRADGLLVLRYHCTQIMDPTDQDLVEADLVRVGIPRTH